MAALGVKKTAWQGLTDKQKALVKFASSRLALGVPAQYEDGSGDVWFVFDDNRLTFKHLAYFGTLVANLTSVPAGYVLPTDGGGAPDREQIESDLVGFLSSRVVPPKDITYTELVTVQVPERVWETRTIDGEEVTGWFETGQMVDVEVEQPLPNPWQVTLDAQGTSAAVRAGGSVPASWKELEAA